MISPSLLIPVVAFSMTAGGTRGLAWVVIRRSTMGSVSNCTKQALLLDRCCCFYYPGWPVSALLLLDAAVAGRPLTEASELFRLLRDLSMLAVVLCDLTT